MVVKVGIKYAPRICDNIYKIVEDNLYFTSGLITITSPISILFIYI